MLAYEIVLHLEQLQAQHLGAGNERIGPAVPDPIASSTRSSAWLPCWATV